MKNRALAFLGDLTALRRKLGRAGTPAAKLYGSIENLARTRPDEFPWYCPLVAVVEATPEAVENARRQLRNYVAQFPEKQLGMGVHFHFWCEAFPHARWCLAFAWIDELFGWEPEERARLLEQLVRYQFRNFFYGLRTKVAECLDNQTLALAFSNAMCAYLFAGEPAVGALARRMGRDGFRRLPELLERTPGSGYSGEGSTYMDHVQGIGNTLSIELLRLATGADPFPSCRMALEAIRRLWMPGGLLLPLDHYGYCRPSRSSMAYLARRTGSPYAHELLNCAAHFGNDLKIAWGMDDWVWTAIWQPDAAPGGGFESWAHPEWGGALVDDANTLYLMQMWDATGGPPWREHVNPNNLVLAAWGSPLTVDGVGTADCERFHFAGTGVGRGGMDFETKIYWFGEGCAGGHGVLLPDRREALFPAVRAAGKLTEFEPEKKILTGDVTDFYHACGLPDLRRMTRQSRLADNRFWVIADYAEFAEEHSLTTRWLLRPERIPARRGVAVRTAEGVRLHLIPALGAPELAVEEIAGFPSTLEQRTMLADFTERGRIFRQLWVAFPVNERETVADATTGWTVEISGKQHVLPLELPPDLTAGLRSADGFWHCRKTLEVPADGTYELRLPCGLNGSRLRLNGRPVAIADERAKLLPTLLPVPAGRVEIELEIPDRAEPDGDNLVRIGGGAALLRVLDLPEPEVEAADDRLTVRWNGEITQIPMREFRI